MRFELFVASRYLRAKRRQAVIGVITGISIAGVAAGVASLIVALAINNGFRQDLQDRLLGSTSNVNLLRIQSDGIKDWRPLMERLAREPHVVATAPAIYEQVLISRGPRARGAVLKGIIPEDERKVSDLLNTVNIGSADALEEGTGGVGRVEPGLRPGLGGSETRPHTSRSADALEEGTGGVAPDGRVEPDGRAEPGLRPGLGGSETRPHTSRSADALEEGTGGVEPNGRVEPGLRPGLGGSETRPHTSSAGASGSETFPDNRPHTGRAGVESPDSLEAVETRLAAMPPIILGKDMADDLGATVGSVVLVTSPQGELTPFGMAPKYSRFRVAGIFNSGFYDYDSSWAFTRLAAAQRLFGLGDLISVIEFKVDDIYKADQVAGEIEKAAGAGFMATNWMEQNKALFRALRLERVVTFITIGLIVFVAALNILISLTMMVMEKTRDIAVLMSMGTRKSQVRRLFVAQGVLIGVIGTAIGLVLGYALAWAGARYHLISLSPEVYSIDYVPFAPRAIDGVLVALVSIGISFIATLYPSWSAARILPAEALRYE